MPRGAHPVSLPSLTVHVVCQAKHSVVVRMLIDTGASYTMIPLKVARALGYDPSVAQRIPVITASAVEYTPLVTVPTMKCLGYQLRNVPVVCHDLPPQSAVDGLLGLNALVHIPAFRTFLASIRSHILSS